jgi:hypothetical protein
VDVNFIPFVFFNDKNRKTRVLFPKNPINVELFTPFKLEKKYLNCYCINFRVDETIPFVPVSL